MHERYIVDQNKLPFKYGRRDTAATGCGWVAVYNVLQMLGVPASLESVRRDMEKLLLFGGFNGTPFYAPIVYFLCRGFRVHVTAKEHRFDRMARKAPASILFYMYYQKGKYYLSGHFVAFQPHPDGRYHFYNDLPGNPTDYRTMGQFLADHKTVLVLLISVEK